MLTLDSILNDLSVKKVDRVMSASVEGGTSKSYGSKRSSGGSSSNSGGSKKSHRSGGSNSNSGGRVKKSSKRTAVTLVQSCSCSCYGHKW